jgi:hypothetical protein
MALKGPQKSLKKWSEQDWGYVNPKDKDKPRKKRGRYLPKSVRRKMTAREKAAENRKKRKANREGRQNASYSKKTARRVRRAS